MLVTEVSVTSLDVPMMKREGLQTENECSRGCPLRCELIIANVTPIFMNATKMKMTSGLLSIISATTSPRFSPLLMAQLATMPVLDPLEQIICSDHVLWFENSSTCA